MLPFIAIISISKVIANLENITNYWQIKEEKAVWFTAIITVFFTNKKQFDTIN